MVRASRSVSLPALVTVALLCPGCAAVPGDDAHAADGAAAAVAGKPAPPPAKPHAEPPLAASRRNLFLNPSFESGRTPWYSMAGPDRPYWNDFSLDDGMAHTGRRAAVLRLTNEGYDGPTRIWGVVQETAPHEMPRRLAAWYRVEGWKRGTAHQYLQAVVIVWLPEGYPATNIQVSYVLGGITEPPFQISNRKFVFLGPKEPEQGKWLRLERDLHEDFRRLWGAVPADFTRLRILFEVRYDGRVPSDPEAAARVWYDDLYIGP